MSDERAITHARENGWVYGDRRGHQFWWLETHGGGHGRVCANIDDPWIVAKFDHDDRCDECGQWLDHTENGTTTTCSTCRHYLEHIAEFGPLDVVVGDDEKRRGYHIGTVGLSTSPSHCLGFGGMRMQVRFFDGRDITTNNLWCWSTSIPQRFFDRLPVNAAMNSGAAVSSPGGNSE